MNFIISPIVDFYYKFLLYISLIGLYIKNWLFFSLSSIIQVLSIDVIKKEDKDKVKNFYDDYKLYNITIRYQLWRFLYIFTWFLNKKYYKIRIKTINNTYKILSNADFYDIYINMLKENYKPHIKPLIKFIYMDIDLTKDILPYTYYNNNFEDFILFNSRDGKLASINTKYSAYIHTNTFTKKTDYFLEYHVLGKPKRYYLMKNVLKHLDNYIPTLNNL